MSVQRTGVSAAESVAGTATSTVTLCAGRGSRKRITVQALAIQSMSITLELRMRLKNFNINKLLDTPQKAVEEEQNSKHLLPDKPPKIITQDREIELVAFMPPGAIRGQENEDRVLLALHKFGWLTTRQIAQIVWPKGRAAIPMARRVLARLRNKRFLVSRPLPQQNHAWVLATEGVRRLHEIGCKDAKRGTDLLRGKKGNVWFHRWLANEILIQTGLPFESFSTEYEIQGHRSPLSKYPSLEHRYLGKIPDALIITKNVDGTIHLDWIEVELSKKRKSDLRRLVYFMTEAFSDQYIINGKLYLSSIRLYFAHNGANPKTTNDAIQNLQTIASKLRKELQINPNTPHSPTRHLLRSHVRENTIITLLDIRQGPVFKGITQRIHLDNVLRYQNRQNIKDMLIG